MQTFKQDNVQESEPVLAKEEVTGEFERINTDLGLEMLYLHGKKSGEKDE